MPERAVIQIDFSGGTDERTDARHVVPGKLLSLKNGVFEKSGSIRKRKGYTALSQTLLDGSSLSGALKLATFGDELVCHDGESLFSYSSTFDRWADKGDLPAIAAVREPVVHGGSILRSPDVAYGNGYLICTWYVFDNATSTHLVYVSVLDVAGGSKVYGTYELAEGYLSRVVVLGTTAYVFFMGSVAGNIQVRTLNLASPSSWTATATVISDGSTSDEWRRFDVCALSDRIVVVYTNNGAGDRVSVKSFNSALTQLATSTVTTTDVTDRWEYAIRGTTGERIWLAYSGNDAGTVTLLAATLNDSTLALVNSVAVMAGGVDENPFVGIERIDSTNAIVTWFEYGASAVLAAKYQRVSSGAVLGGSGALQRHVWTSRPFMVGDRCYAMGAYGHTRDDSTSYGFLFQLPIESSSDQVPLEVARIAAERTTCPNVNPWSQCSVANLGSGQYAAACNIKNLATFGIDTVTFAFPSTLETPPALSGPQELGGALHFAGGVPCAYDSVRVIESSFALPAEQPYGVQQTTASGGIENGTYNYVIVFARHDSSGQVYRSAPSVPLEVVVNGADPASNTVSFRVPSLPVSRSYESGGPESQNVSIEVYRTEAGGSSFFLVENVGWGPTSADNFGIAINDPTRVYTFIEDITVDSDLDGQPLLYTTGGIVENAPAPSASVQIVHKDRLWLAGTDESKIVWFSKKRVFAEGPGFSSLFTVTVEDGGNVTALASLDSHLIIFKRDRIFYVDGDGPPDTGGEGFTDPQRISADLGCIEPRSVVTTPEGVFFQSSAGIYLLDRGLGLSYVSGPVEDTLAAYPVITSTVVHESQFHARFSCTNEAGTSGVVLVLDYLTKQWSTFEIYESVAANTKAPIVSACNHDGTYKWIAANGAAYAESDTEYTDDGQWVTLSLETSWLKMAGLQGWQRAWSMSVLGERFTPHDLVISVGNDYAATYHQTTTWSDEDIEEMPLEQIRTAMVRQKCQAIRFKLADATPTGGGAVGTGRGLAFNGIAIEAAILNKTRRLPAAQRG